jgi:hypothetical protein
MLVVCALPGVVHGCSSPTEPVQPPGGGQRLTLSYAQFEASVEPVLVQHGCDAGGDCHGGGIRGSFELSPQGAKNVQFDFDQVGLQVSAYDRDHSPILTEPLALAAGGTAHPVKVFADTSDADYQTLRGWIRAGVVQ